MADEVKRAKNLRRGKLGSFTRKKNHLVQLLEGGAKGDKLKSEYAELLEAYKVLESSHEDVLVVLEEEDLDAEDSFLDASAKSLAEVDLRIVTAGETEAQQDAEEQARIKATEAETNRKKEHAEALSLFQANIENFGKPATNLSDLSKAKIISHADMRLEIAKLEDMFAKLLQEKVKVANLDASVDLNTEIEQVKVIGVELDQCRKIALEYLKDAPVTSASAEPTGRARATTASFSTTKRETVMLPQFSGDERSAYLQYPVWKKQWESHISQSMSQNIEQLCF